jgi:predicted SnoaL-like aldol condensation-catalyzing enzyme
MTQGGLPTGGSHAEPEEAARANFYRLLLQQVITMFNTGDTVSAWRVFSPEYVDHQKPTFIDADGPEEFITIVALARRSLPNLRVTIEDVLVEGDKLVARLRWHGAAAPGRTISRETIEILRFEDDHIAEHWGSEVSSADSADAGEPGAGS